MRVSVRTLAKVSGVSKSTVGYALNNHPQVSKQTKERVLRAAEQLGYSPDPRISAWMSTVREAKCKELLALAWLNTNCRQDAWRRHKCLSPYLEGAREMAYKMGYRIDEIWAPHPEISMRHVARVIYQRGIEGVIITHPARHFRLSYEHLAAVGIEGALLAPHIDKVASDVASNLNLALKMLKRGGYQRIGICLEEKLDRYSEHAVRATVCDFNLRLPQRQRIAPFFFREERLSDEGEESWRMAREEVADWVRRCKPDVVVGHSYWLLEAVQSAGFRVPEEVGVVHLAKDDDAKDWAGIDSNRRKIGAMAAKQVISFVHSAQFGVPDVPSRTLIRGSWQNGNTLILPKSA